MAERLIRESDVIKLIDEWLDNYPLPRHVEKGLMSHEELLAYIAEAPTIEVVPKELYEQILWERNIAMEQLEEHGIGFASKKE